MHLTPNLSYPLMIIISALMLPVMIVRFYMGVWQMMLLDFPLIVASFWSISAFYVIAQRELHPKSWKRTFLFLPMLMAVGVGLTLINTRAVLEALFGVQSGFVRTPKYAIEGNQQKRMAVKKYKSRSGWLPYFELACGTYFLYMCVFAIQTYNFPSLPFLALFVGGYYWAGFGTLYQEYQDRLRYNRQVKLAFETARARLQFEHHILTPEMIREAAERIRPLARRTPVMTSRSIDDRAGVSLFLKCENFQRSGAFKIRGAANLILSLNADELKRGIVAFSSGNHAQAVAIAAKYVGAAATIVMPEDAPQSKMEPTRALGARIVTYDRMRDDREKIAANVLRKQAAYWRHPTIIR